MLDSGSDVNLIRERCVHSSLVSNKSNPVMLQGISSIPVTTLGSVNIRLLGQQIEFHLIPNDAPFLQDGILGIGFLKERNAVLDFKNKCLLFDGSSIPFTEVECVTLEPRSVTPFHALVTNPEKGTGYIPLIKSVDGIYFGDAIVTNSNGKAYLPIFNTNEQYYNMEVPSIVLQEYDTLDTLTSLTGAAEAANGLCVSKTNASSPSQCQSSRLYESHDPTNSKKSHYSIINEVTPYDTQDIHRGSNTSCGAIDPRKFRLASGRRSNFNITSSSNFDDRVDLILQLLRVDHLNSEERSNLITLIQEHSDRFHLPFDRLEYTNAAQHSIPTINEAPIHTKQYRFPPIHKEEINNQVNTLLSDEIIEYSNSPYNSPLWIVPKKPDSAGNKRWRMVIDYRALNEKTIGDAYPLPNITDILDQLGNAKYFSVLDLASGFHQIPMDSKDAPKTAFSTPHGHYQFKRMPFGLKNAPATFQRLMDNVLSGLQGNELFVYMDDIVIYARSLQEHSVKFNRLMKRLRDANLKLQPDKCEFLRKEVAYLGHVIGSDGVKPDPNKIKAITNFPTPRNPKGIKQFLGLVGYYRRFIPQFSKIAKPLTDLLKKDKAFIWETLQTRAFDELRNFLCTEPILRYPDFTQTFVLTTDASGYAIGGVLSQGKIGKDLPIAYVSRILNKAEQNYSTIEKECLAIVYCTNHFRPYLYGMKFIIITDHKPLVWLHSIKDPSSRLWKWRTKLAEYEYDIQYKKGSLNHNADALSRNPPSVRTLSLTVQPPDPDSDESLDEEILANFEPVEDELEEIPPSPEPQELIVEEVNEETNESHFSLESDTESDDSEHLSLPPDSVPTEINEQVNEQPKTIDSRDSLLKQKDNIVIFIYMSGAPFDNGAKELQKAGQLPQYRDIVYERAKVSSIGNKTLIALPLKLNDRTPIEAENIKGCMQSLADVMEQLRLPSFSIHKTEKFDDIPWTYVLKQLIKYLENIPTKITICKNLVQTPEVHERLPLIAESHSSAVGGHKGVTKTYNRLRPHFYWNTMKKEIQEFIQKCRQCQIKKLTRVKNKQPMIITDTPGSAFDKVSLDIMGPLPVTRMGNSYILTIQDLLTKYSVAVPLQRAFSVTIADALTKNFICLYGAPRAILTDQGTNFLSSLIRNLTKKFNIKHFKTTAYHPQSNGSLERSHHVLTEYLKTQINKDNEWDEHIALAMFSYNTSVHESTQYSPFELVFGRLPRIPTSHPPIEEETDTTYRQYLTELFNKLYDTQEDARQHLIKSKIRSKRYYDKRINPCNLQPGNNVYLLKEPRRGKFADQYTGPYKVLEILSHNNIKILFHNRPRIVHIDKLKISHVEPG